ncbi:MAG: type II toxin-antitoxin system RelB/DinJ family antitoxin [Lachnospirales bacterium]
MANKSANLYARIEPYVKEQAKDIFSTLGLSTSNAINIFFKQVILNKGMPFEVKVPQPNIIDISNLSDEEFKAEIEKGYSSMINDNSKPDKNVFNNLRKKHNI